MIFLLLPFSLGYSQILEGRIKSEVFLEPLKDITVEIETLQVKTHTDSLGFFVLKVDVIDTVVVNFSHLGYIQKKMKVIIDSPKPKNLGVIYLETTTNQSNTDYLVAISDDELSNDAFDLESSVSLLQSGRDLFTSRLAFDWSQAFYRARGLSSDKTTVLINGFKMNSLANQSPNWSHWGGLNHITNNQELNYGLSAIDTEFGGLLGTSQITMDPSLMGKRMRLTTSLGNSSYLTRLMGTYSSGLLPNGLAFSISASKRFSKQGYMEGNSFDATAVHLSIAYLLKKNHRFILTGFYTPTVRGQNTALTNEIIGLSNRNYNPNWGYQDQEKRNSRVKETKMPTVLFNYNLNIQKIELFTGIGYQKGIENKSRLDYFNSENPDPLYYRKQPSYILKNLPENRQDDNQKITSNFINQKQINWQQLYEANLIGNEDGKSLYLLSKDETESENVMAFSNIKWQPSPLFNISIGASQYSTNDESYALIDDLLGSRYHLDIEPFSNTLNDINGSPIKRVNDKYKYRYKINSTENEWFLRTQLTTIRMESSFTFSYKSKSIQRKGLYKNERYPSSSSGNSLRLSFESWGLKSGLKINLSGKQYIDINAGIGHKPPANKTVFFNVREHNGIVENIKNLSYKTFEINHHLRTPNLVSKLTGYYYNIENGFEIAYFYADTGLGSNLFQEVSKGIGTRHIGIELGLTYNLTSSLKLELVSSIGHHHYHKNPEVSINFNGQDKEVSPLEKLDLGTSSLKGYRVSNGPQQAYSIGLRYNHPKYWWISSNFNLLTENYVGLSKVIRTESFYTNPDDVDGYPFPNIDLQAVNRLLSQEKLEHIYLLNINGGKSWRINSSYLNLFISIKNVMNTFYRSGGYEQSRMANYENRLEDNENNNPIFGNKYWLGYGTTVLLNIAYSF